MEIRSISERITKASPNKIKNAQGQTNPFGVSFKGNIISADVFETTEERTGLIEKASNKSRMVISAIVGSVNSMNQALSARMDSMVSFGRKIRENINNVWNYLNTNNLKLNLDIVKKESRNPFKIAFSSRAGLNEIEHMKTMDISELEGMLEQEISARIAG